MFGAKCILLISLISLSSSQFFTTKLSEEVRVDVRKFVNASTHIWTVRIARPSSTGKIVKFSCKVDIIEKKETDFFTFTRKVEADQAEEPAKWVGHYRGSGDNYPLILLNHTEEDSAGPFEFVAYIDPGNQCGIYFTGIILKSILKAKENTWPTLLSPENIGNLRKMGMGYVMCEERRNGTSTGPVITNACEKKMLALCGDGNYISSSSTTSCGADETLQQ